MLVAPYFLSSIQHHQAQGMHSYARLIHAVCSPAYAHKPWQAQALDTSPTSSPTALHPTSGRCCPLPAQDRRRATTWDWRPSQAACSTSSAEMTAVCALTACLQVCKCACSTCKDDWFDLCCTDSNDPLTPLLKGGCGGCSKLKPQRKTH